MEVIKKTVQMVMTTGTTACTSGTCYIIIPNTGVTYYFKIGLTAEMQDIGFFDAYAPIIIEPEPEPEPGEETYQYEDSDDSPFTDSDDTYFVWDIIL